MGKRLVPLACPHCGSTASVPVSPRALIHYHADRQCSACLATYTPPTPRLGSLLLVLTGALVIAEPAYVVWADPRLAAHWLVAVWGMLACAFGAACLFAGVDTLFESHAPASAPAAADAPPSELSASTAASLLAATEGSAGETTAQAPSTSETSLAMVAVEVPAIDPAPPDPAESHAIVDAATVAEVIEPVAEATFVPAEPSPAISEVIADSCATATAQSTTVPEPTASVFSSTPVADDPITAPATISPEPAEVDEPAPLPLSALDTPAEPAPAVAQTSELPAPATVTADSAPANLETTAAEEPPLPHHTPRVLSLSELADRVGMAGLEFQPDQPVIAVSTPRRAAQTVSVAIPVAAFEAQIPPSSGNSEPAPSPATADDLGSPASNDAQDRGPDEVQAYTSPVTVTAPNNLSPSAPATSAPGNESAPSMERSGSPLRSEPGVDQANAPAVAKASEPVATVAPSPWNAEHNLCGINYRDPMPWPKVKGKVIDFHCHLLAARHAKAWFETAAHYGIDTFVTMTPLEEVLVLQRQWPGRLHFIAVPQWYYEGSDFLGDWLRRIEMFYNLGSRMVKFHMAPQTILRRGWRLDSPQLEPVFREIEARGMMIMTHVGDPDLWYNGRYADPAKYGTRDDHYRMWEGMLERCRNIPWVGAHMGGNPENLPRLQSMLDRFPNLMLDCSATRWMAREISARREEARDFFIRNADRILFGSDQVSGDDRGFDFLASRFWVHRKLWESAYVGPCPIADPDLPDHAGPTLRGLCLPNDVLQKLYRDNAVALMAKAGIRLE